MIDLSKLSAQEIIDKVESGEIPYHECKNFTEYIKWVEDIE